MKKRFFVTVSPRLQIPLFKSAQKWKGGIHIDLPDSYCEFGKNDALFSLSMPLSHEPIA